MHNVDYSRPSLPTYAPGRLSTRTLAILMRLLARYCQPSLIRIERHAPTFTAQETQAVLPPGVLVQKTVTGRMQGHILLWTGVGTYRLAKPQLAEVASHLGLPGSATKHHTCNPSNVVPQQEYGLLPGMISPFFDPQKGKRLAALVLLPIISQEKSVAISFSLTESLIIPLPILHPLVLAYAREAYPQVSIINLSKAIAGD